MSILTMSELDLTSKRVLIREDFNVPIQNQKVVSDARIKAALPTIELALAKGASVILLSHLGRPTEGQFDNQYSLAPVAKHLSELLNKPVPLLSDWLDGVTIAPGEIVLCENVRFNKGEKSNADALAQRMAKLCDIFVMDAFGTAHRAEASTYGVAQYAPLACAGPLLAAELTALRKALKNPARPLIAIVGGSKVSTKLTVLESLLATVDQLIVGGGIANTFLAASGIPIGKSLFEAELLDTAKALMAQAKARGAAIPLPTDVVVAKQFAADAIASIKPVAAIAPDEMILDIGPTTAKHFAALLKDAGTILWNGPVGVFEFDVFAAGTRELAMAIAESKAFSIAGGGDTLAAIDKYLINDKLSYISTGGGAFLEFIEGKTLPAVAILEQRATVLESVN